jgi:hypothetical protein
MIFYDKKRVVKINESEYSLYFSLFSRAAGTSNHFSVISNDCNDLKVISLCFVKCLYYDVFFQLETMCCDFSSFLDFLTVRSCNVNGVSTNRRKIRLVEGNAKCRHLSKLT